MENKYSRRAAMKKIAGSAALITGTSFLASRIQAAEAALGNELQGKINHSVCKWCYANIPLEELCVAAKEIGITSIELQGPKEWPIIKKHGLTCAMPWGAGLGIEKGFNEPQYHDELVKSFSEVIPLASKAGFDKIICFSGNRNGMDDETGLQNATKGLKRLMKVAEDNKVTMVMELLNSKVNHKDYHCDKTAWGVELCDRVGSENLKLLYDIYHMQIMEGDVIRTIKDFHPYFAHYHTGGVPGRNEIDETQELFYPAIMRAIIETGYTGFVGQEFVPSRGNDLASLRQGVEICDV
ncbi:TIM barrel protein [soil metagenome]